jgi:hypothetical protein
LATRVAWDHAEVGDLPARAKKAAITFILNAVYYIYPESAIAAVAFRVIGGTGRRPSVRQIDARLNRRYVVVEELMTAPLAGDCNPAAAAAAPAVDVPAQKLDPDLEAVLRPFLNQSVAVTSIVAIGCPQLWMQNGGRNEGAAPLTTCNEAVLLRLVTNADAGLAIVARIPIPPAGDGPGGCQIHTLDSLARQARGLCR